MDQEQKDAIERSRARLEGEPLPLREVDLPDEGADRAFVTPSGNRFRARVRLTDQAVAKAPTASAAAVMMPTKFTLTISLSLLDDQDQVVQRGGRYMIFDAKELLVSDDQLASGGMDLDRIIMDTIAQRAADAEAVMEAKGEAAAVLAKGWGITL